MDEIGEVARAVAQVRHPRRPPLGLGRGGSEPAPHAKIIGLTCGVVCEPAIDRVRRVGQQLVHGPAGA